MASDREGEEFCLFNKFRKEVHWAGERPGMLTDLGVSSDEVVAAPANLSCLTEWCKSATLRLEPLPGEYSSAPLQTIAVAAISSALLAIAAADHPKLAGEGIDHCCAEGEEVYAPRP